MNNNMATVVLDNHNNAIAKKSGDEIGGSFGLCMATVVRSYNLLTLGQFFK
jgi:hypothetical protein